jgi:hypothetical protein
MQVMEDHRADLVRRLLQAAETMVQGSLSETTRTCGNPGCRCHRGQRHGPHTYLTYRKADGRTTGVYVPAAARAEAQAATAAWREFWEVASALAADNRDRTVQRWRAQARARRGGTHAAT